METRRGDDETRLLRRRVQELDQANLELKRELAEVERRRRHLASMVLRLQRRNAVLSAAAEQRSGVVSFLKKGSGLWSRQVHYPVDDARALARRQRGRALLEDALLHEK